MPRPLKSGSPTGGADPSPQCEGSGWRSGWVPLHASVAPKDSRPRHSRALIIPNAFRTSRPERSEGSARRSPACGNVAPSLREDPSPPDGEGIVHAPGCRQRGAICDARTRPLILCALRTRHPGRRVHVASWATGSRVIPSAATDPLPGCPNRENLAGLAVFRSYAPVRGLELQARALWAPGRRRTAEACSACRRSAIPPHPRRRNTTTSRAVRELPRSATLP
jgi:hypothetical protein